MNNSIYNKSVRPTDNILLALIYMAAGFSILLLIGIMGYVFVRGIPQISWEFLKLRFPAPPREPSESWEIS